MPRMRRFADRKPSPAKASALLCWNLRVHDRRGDAIHMVAVTRQAVLTRHVAGVARLAELLLHLAEARHEVPRITLLVALQIWAAPFNAMAGLAAALLQDAEMRLMDEMREAPLFALGRGNGEIDDPPFAPDIVDAVAFRA